jgi:hypothetical protein
MVDLLSSSFGSSAETWETCHELLCALAVHQSSDLGIKNETDDGSTHARYRVGFQTYIECRDRRDQKLLETDEQHHNIFVVRQDQGNTTVNNNI